MTPHGVVIASDALITRFITTCWIWERSASSGGRFGARMKRTADFFEIDILSICSISMMTAFRSRVLFTKRPLPE